MSLVWFLKAPFGLKRPCLSTFKSLFIAVIFLLVLTLQSAAQSHSPFPLDVRVGPAPQPIVADGRTRLVYELQVTNFAPFQIELTGINVFGDSQSPLANFSGEALEKMVVPAERVVVWATPADDAPKARMIGAGHSALIFFDLTLDAGVRAPVKLHHSFSLSFPGKNGAAVEYTVSSAAVAVVQQPALILRPPLRGKSWVAFNAFSNGAVSDHRRAANAVDGKIYIAQRFAIDWGRLGPDQRLFHGDAKSNANFYSYGSEVLAVADARVADLKDGFPDNTGSNDRSSRHITLDNVLGNYLALDLGDGHFAFYAHLQPGSFKVKVGDTVKVGQVLALLGNSGNSDAPHLHFQVTDANSPIGSEGIPFELDVFTQLGVLDGPNVLDDGQAWQPKSQEKPTVRKQDFPVDNAVVSFP